MKTIAIALFVALLSPLAAWSAEPPAHLTGGIGQEERETLKSRAGEFSLHLSIAEAGAGHYLSGARVLVEKANGGEVLAVDGAGPWFYAALPPGRYRVTVEAEGRKETRPVRITGRRPAELRFYWPAAKGE